MILTTLTLANGVSLVALKDVSLARDAEADGTLEYLLQLLLQVVQRLFCHVRSTTPTLNII